MNDQSPAAFARPRSADPEDFHNPETYHAQEGLTMRDYFAAHASEDDISCAIFDLSASGGLDGCTSGFARRSVARYACADAMLMERAK